MPDWDRVSFVVRSRHREAVLRQLRGGPQTPSNLARRLNISISHTSQLLSSLRQKGLVVCLTPSAVRGRLFSLSKKGQDVLDHLTQPKT
jgi:ArsR family transcriptional regulator, cadmium/lead-responsive transcriptional repressor